MDWLDWRAREHLETHQHYYLSDGANKWPKQLEAKPVRLGVKTASAPYQQISLYYARHLDGEDYRVNGNVHSRHRTIRIPDPTIKGSAWLNRKWHQKSRPVLWRTSSTVEKVKDCERVGAPSFKGTVRVWKSKDENIGGTTLWYEQERLAHLTVAVWNSHPRHRR